MNNLLETREFGNYRINIYQDDMPSCPCCEWDMLGIHLFDYDCSGSLSPSCNHEEVNATSLRDALSELVCQYVPQKKVIDYINAYCDELQFTYDRHNHMWYLKSYSSFLKTWSVEFDLTPSEVRSGDYVDCFMEYLESDDFSWLLNNCQHEIAFHEWSSSGYSQGDYVEGISFCTRERFFKHYGKLVKDWRERAVECMEGETDDIGKWMWGDVIGYTLEKKVRSTKIYQDGSRESEDCEEWVEIDSCWGYYCTSGELIDMIAEEKGIQSKDAA